MASASPVDTHTFYLPDGTRLDIEQTGKWVERGGLEPDPYWLHVDTAGHGHFYFCARDSYPTLNWVAEYCALHGEDCTSNGHYECKTCGEHVKPGKREAKPEFVRGPFNVTVTYQDGMASRTYHLSTRNYKGMCEVLHEALGGFLAAMDPTEVSISAT